MGDFDVQRATEQFGFPLVLADIPNRAAEYSDHHRNGRALPHVAQKMAEDPALYDQLAALTDPSKEGQTLDEQIATDLAFHRALLAASGLGPLVAFNDLLQIFFNRFRETFDPPNLEKKVQGHLHIIDALRRGDVQSACEALASTLSVTTLTCNGCSRAKPSVHRRSVHCQVGLAASRARCQRTRRQQ